LWSSSQPLMMMLDSRVCALPPPPSLLHDPSVVSLLGEHNRLLDRLDRERGLTGLGLGLRGGGGGVVGGGGLSSGGFSPQHASSSVFGSSSPLAHRLWRPTAWGSPPPPPSACLPPLPPPPLPTSLSLCPDPCSLSSALSGVGVGLPHLYDHLASARLWYPWYYKGRSS
jgi:hypothetical protein